MWMTVPGGGPCPCLWNSLCWGPRVHGLEFPGHLQQEAGCRAGSDNEMQRFLMPEVADHLYFMLAVGTSEVPMVFEHQLPHT